MLRCPYCDTDLSAGSSRLRGGRCPSCGSILNWAGGDDDAPASEFKPPQPPPEAVDEDAMSMKDIVRTLVGRSAFDDPPPENKPPSSNKPASGSKPAGPIGKTVESAGGPPAARGGFRKMGAESPPPPDGGAAGADQVDRVWSKSLTSVATKPSMTIKASSNEPDEAISDLFIRPFKIAQPGEITQATNEFELQEVIGEGGVGVVYAARQASIDRTVAIKMLRDEFAHKRDHRNKFLSEAVVTGELDHPNIVPIYDLGTSDLGNLFYAMKRVRGTPWSEVVRQQTLAENLRILMSVADAIAFAHSRGVIHRDLKPENVMLGDFGEVLVMDWGIALSTTMFVKSNKIGQSTSMGGTPAYMAPEMATGPLTAIGQLSDVYLLGAMLYEIITGRTPHTGKDVMSCLYAAARNEIQPTDKKGELLDIAYRAMATKPAERHASVQDFQVAIREYQSHSESIVLSTRADEELKEAERTKDYQDYSRALFGFQEARTLWSGNERAKTGEVEARLAYADRALSKGDFDLGLSLLDERQPNQVSLHRKLTAARHEREARQARIKGLRRLAIGLAALVMLTLSIGMYFISGQNRTISKQYGELNLKNEALLKTQDDLKRQTKKATDSADSLRVKTDELASTNVNLKTTRQQAINEAQTARQEEQNAAAASYRAQIGVAAERIANNSFLDAKRLLDDYEGSTARWSYFRHWEWGYLNHLCNRQAGQYNIGPRIESLARSADGRLYAAGTVTGEVLVFEIDWDTRTVKPVPALKPNGPALPVLAVALSPDGGQLAIGDADRGAIALYARNPAGGYAKAGEPLVGQNSGVLSLAYSPSGKLMLSTSRDGTARLWDVAARQTVQPLIGHSGPVHAGAFSPAGDVVVTGGDDGTVRLWQVGENKSRTYRGHKEPVYAVAYAPKGNWIASAGRDREVHVWPAGMDLGIDYLGIAKEVKKELEGKLVAEPRQAFHTPSYRLTGHTGEVRALSFSADGTRVLSGGNDNTVKLWHFAADRAAADFVTTFRGHGGWVHGCVLAADPRYAVSSSLDGLVKIWDAQQYEEVRALRGHEDAVLWAAFSRSGQRMVTAGRDRKALVWSVGERQPLKVFDEGDPEDPAAAPAANPAARLKEGHEFLVSSVAFFPDEERVLTSAGDGTVRIWDRRTGGQVRRLLNTGSLSVLALSPGGEWIVTGSGADNAQKQQGALLWAAEDDNSEPIKLIAHPGEVSAAAFSPGRDLATLRIATGDVLGQVRLWQFEPSSQSWRPSPVTGHTPGFPISAIRFTPDGRKLLTASQDRTVLLHDAITGEPLKPALRHKGGVRALEVSADSRRALTISSPTKGQSRVSLWDLTSGAEQFADSNLTDEPLTSVVFHPREAAAIVTSSNASRNMSRFWRWEFGSPSLAPHWQQHQLRGAVWSAAFSQDGSRVLAGGGSQARLLTAAQGQVERTFSPHAAVTAADFSPDESLLATSSLDGDVKLWHADPQHPQYGRVAFKLAHAHGSGPQPVPINFIAFSPIVEGNTLRFVTAGNDSMARLWRYAAGAATPEGAVLRHDLRVRSAVFSPDGKLVLTASDDMKARLWDVSGDQPGLPVVLNHKAAVLFAAFSPDGTRVITGCDDNLARVWKLSSVWNVNDPPADVTLPGHTAAVTSAAISPDGLRAITGSQDGMAKLWDLETGKTAKEVLSLKRHGAELTSVHFSPDGGSILTSSLDGLALVWPAVKMGPSVKLSLARREISREPGAYPLDEQARIFDPDASALAGGTLAIWPAASSAAAALELPAASGREIDGDQNVWLAGAGGRRRVALLERPADLPGGLRLRFLEGGDAADAQSLLRAIAIRSTGPLTADWTVRVQITDAEGRASFVAETIVNSAAEQAAASEFALK